MKTQVEIIGGYEHAQIPVGSFGYIDGYVQAADTRPYAVVVSGEKVDMIPLYCLKVIS